MNFNHWSEHPRLKGMSFLAINISNHNENTRQINATLFDQQKTGQWDIKREILRAGLLNKFVVLFYSNPGTASTLYFGKIKATDITGETDHTPPRDRYELEVQAPWQNFGMSDVSFSRFFDGVTMISSPTTVWVNAARKNTENTHSNSYCEAWLGDQWQQILVSEARMHYKPLVRCIECHGAVVLMKAGPGGIPRAHAEHRPGHEGCSLGHYYKGVSFPHPYPIQELTDGSRDPFADLVINEDDESAFPEGAESYQLHKKRERDPNIVLQAKAKRFRESNKLECEVCLTDFHLVYGSLGYGFIEAHHKVPVAQLDGIGHTKIDDLAMVCSNCHRMLHRSGGRTVEELREIVQSAYSATSD